MKFEMHNAEVYIDLHSLDLRAIPVDSDYTHVKIGDDVHVIDGYAYESHDMWYYTLQELDSETLEQEEYISYTVYGVIRSKTDTYVLISKIYY